MFSSALARSTGEDQRSGPRNQHIDNSNGRWPDLCLARSLRRPQQQHASSDEV